jgi:hypothetical protein
MERAEADRLIAELGDALGMPDLALDANGVCSLVIDGALVPTFGHNPRAGSLDMMICLDGVIPDAALMRDLLEANFGWLDGFGYALSPASGALVLQRRCTPHDCRGGLRPLLEALLGAAERMAKASSRPAAEATAESWGIRA